MKEFYHAMNKTQESAPEPGSIPERALYALAQTSYALTFRDCWS
jgi:hypothetical protein